MADNNPLVGSNLYSSFADSLAKLTPNTVNTPAPQPVGAQLFSNYANGLVAQKQATIEGKTAQKQIAIDPNTVASMSPMERAAAYATAIQSGDNQTATVVNTAENDEELQRRIGQANRGVSGIAGDTALSLAKGIGNLGAGTAELAMETSPQGVVGNLARNTAWVADKLGAQDSANQLNKFGDSLKTDTNKIRAGIANTNAGIQNWATDRMSAPSQLDIAQNDESQKLDEADSKAMTKDGMWEQAKRFGRDAKSSVSNMADNPLAVEDLVVQQLPQLLTGGLSRASAVDSIGNTVGSKILNKAADAAEKATLKAGGTEADAELARISATSKLADYAGRQNAKAIDDLAEKNQLLSIGIQEASGTADQTEQQVLQMKNEDLAKSSPEYQRMIAEGMSPDDAKNAVAANAANIAASVQLPAAMLFGKAAAKFETKPFATGTGNIAARTLTSAKNIGKEVMEEVPQNTGGQLATNLGVQQTADTNQDLLEGAGNSAAQGFVGALGMSGAVQTPGLAKQATVDTAKAIKDNVPNAVSNVASVVGSGVNKVAESRVKNNAENKTAAEDETANKESFENAVNTYDENIGKDDVETPVQETETKSDGDVESTDNNNLSAVAATRDAVNAPVDETTLSNVFSKQGQQAIKDIDAMRGNTAQKLGNVMQVLDNSPELDSNVRRAMEIYANDKLVILADHRDAIDNALANNEADSKPELKARLEAQRDAINTIVNNPTAQKLLDVYDEDKLSQEDFDKAIESLPSDITPENIDTPEVQNAFSAIKEKSVTNPLTVTGDQYRQVLNHDTSLTSMQRTVLEAKAKIADFLANHETVSNNIRNDSREEFKSVRDHAKNIFKAMAQKDTKGVQENLGGLRRFAEQQINRFNAHDSRMSDVIRTGMFDDNRYTNVPGYFQLDSKGNKSKDKLQYVNPSAKGKANLNAIAEDTNHIVDVYNALAATVPHVKAEQLKQVTPTWTEAVPNSATEAEKAVFAEQSGVTAKAEPEVTSVDNGLSEKDNNRLSELMSNRNKLTADEKAEVGKLLDKQRTAILGEDTQEEPEAVNEPVTEDTETETSEPVQEETVPEEPAKEEKQTEEKVEPVTTKDEPVEVTETDSTEDAEDTNEPEPVEEKVESSVGKAVLESIPDGSAALTDAKTPAEKSARTNQLKATFQPANPSNYKPRILAESNLEDIAKVTGYALTDSMQKGLNTLQIGMRTIAGSLNKALAAANAKHKIVEKADSPTPAFAMANLKALYATKVENGKVQYIPEFLETMAMSGMHWAVSSQPANMDISRLAKMLNMSENALQANPELLNTLLHAGTPVTSVAGQLAGMIERLLGIKERPDTSRTYGRTITDSLAREVLAAMDAAGIVKITSVPMAESDAVINMVQPIMDEELTQLKEDLGSAVDIIQDYLLPKESKGVSIGSPVKEVSKKVNGDTWQEVPVQVKEFISNQQKVPWKLNKNFYEMQSMLGDKTGYGALVAAGYYDGDVNLLNDAHKAVIDSKNLGLLNGAKAADELVNKLKAQKDGLDTPVYWKYVMDTNGRTRMDASFNPQNNKVIREIFNSTDVEVDMNNPQHMREWYLHLAQGLGIKVDKMSNDLAIRNVRRILGELKLAPQRMAAVTPLHAGIDAIKQGLEHGWDSVSKAQAEDIVEAVRGKDNKYLHTMLSAATGQLAKEQGKTTFNHAVTFEVDGVTDGPGNAYVHFGMTGISANSLDILKKIGWNVNNPDAPSNITHGETPDMYVTSAANIFDMIHKDSQAAALLNYAGQTSLDGENITTGLTRSFAKIVVTPATYGSGVRSMAATVTSSIIDSLYEHLSNVIAGKDSLNVPMLKALDGLAGLNQFAKLEHASPEELKKFTVKESSLKLLNQAMFEDIGDAIYEGINKTVGGALQNNKELSMLADIQGMLFNEAWKKEYNRVRDELIDKGELAPNEMLSINDENKVTKAVEHLAPIYQNGITGNDRANGFNMGTMNKNGIADYLPKSVANKAAAVTLSNKLKATGRGTELTSPGVRTTALSTIGGGDATMMVNGSKELVKENIVANNVFDGLDTRLGEMEKSSDIINAAVAKGWGNDIYLNIISGISSALQNANYNTLDDDTLRKVFKSVLGNTYSKVKVDDLRKNIAKLEAGVNSLVREHQNKALRNSYVKKALLETYSTISHMGGVDKAYNFGEKSYEGTPEEIVMALNARVAELSAKDKVISKVENDASLVKQLTDYGSVNDGLTTLNKDQLLAAMAKYDFGGNKVTRELFKRLTPILSDNLTVYHGDAETIAQLQGKLHPDVAFSPSANASTYGNSIFLTNLSNETLFHEAIHAGIQNAVNQFYANPESLAPEHKTAISKLEILQNQFLNMDKQNTDYSTALDVNYARRNINSYLKEGNESAALNEFIAWGLANQNLQNYLGSRTADKTAQVTSTFADMIGKFKNAVLRLLGFPVNKGQSVLEAMAGNFDNLVTPVAEAQSLNNPYAQADIQQLNHVLNHDGSVTHADYIEGLVRRLNAATKVPIKQQGELLAQNAIDRALIQGDAPKINQAVKAFQSAGWDMSPKEQHAFLLMQAALVSNIQLNPTAMNAMQRMYDSVMPTLTTKDLTASQLDALKGKATVFTDAHGRSTQLANFIALGMTNETFRDVLASRDIPRKEESTGELFDKMAKATRDSIDFLADLGNGTRKQKNAKEAFDVLANKISSINMNTKANLADQATNLLGKGDNLIYKQFEKLAKKAGDKRDERVLNNKNKTTTEQGVNAILSAIEMLDKNSSGQDTLQSAINSSKLWNPLKQLFTEMLGTSKSSMAVNKLLQQAKNQVSAVRQKIRETVPNNVASKFSRELTEKEWSAITHVFGKTDIQSLLSTYKLDDVKDWLTNEKALQNEIDNLEMEVASYKHGSDYLVRSKELAHYLMTGDNISDHLLRNATAIAELAGTGKEVINSSEAVPAIDKLVSLYAIQQTEEGNRTAVSNLLDTERSGMEFIGTYLSTLNNIEQGKMNTYNPLNGYKGTTPVLDSSHKQLVVADAKNGRNLVENYGYVKLPGYVSDSALGNNKLSYYYTTENLTAGYTQGALQTVEPLLHGVDPMTGQTTALRGSYGLSGQAAKLMAKQKRRGIVNAKLGTESGKLMPIFNSNGEITGYEAPIPDAVRYEKLDTNTQMHELLGVTQGRQAEETLAQSFNRAMAGKLADIWKSEKSTTRKNEYINLEESAKTNKVHAQTWDAIPRSAKNMLGLAFDGPVMVRQDMLDNAFGYRNFSVSSVFTNQSGLPEPIQQGIANVATAILGAKAPRYLRKAGRYTQNLVSSAKDWIIVRSVTVFAMNELGNFIQLGQAGVPMSKIIKGQAAKMQEVDAYLRNVNKINTLHSDNLGITDTNQKKKNSMAMQRLMDANARMSIAPLINAGELPTVAEGLTVEDDATISGGGIKWIDDLVDKLPKGASDAVKLAMIAKGTPLHNGLNRMMTYGDFVSKAVLYDKLIEQDKLSKEAALRYIQEEYINYDNNPGRTRNWFESHGFTWFLTYKLKIQKILLRRMRDNPLSSLVYQGVADGLGIDSPFEAALPGDNFWYSFSDPTRAVGAMSMHPAAQILQ